MYHQEIAMRKLSERMMRLVAGHQMDETDKLVTEIFDWSKSEYIFQMQLTLSKYTTKSKEN